MQNEKMGSFGPTAVIALAVGEGIWLASKICRENNIDKPAEKTNMSTAEDWKDAEEFFVQLDETPEEQSTTVEVEIQSEKKAMIAALIEASEATAQEDLVQPKDNSEEKPENNCGENSDTNLQSERHDQSNLIGTVELHEKGTLRAMIPGYTPGIIPEVDEYTDADGTIQLEKICEDPSDETQVIKALLKRNFLVVHGPFDEDDSDGDL